ncbi:hypothetical protein SD15574_2402 [Shigella dysenteriae 155-74]|nr:hypothetical protein Sd1012_4732 [Shigella dysenteriae 1012]EGI93967.1 hypothetical protein SB521682_2438 [Shigella boydii 5216-82]EGI96196.1 hypothetical protein SD15574_2402 [Shigella dysenteriae 155-74]EIQ28882.1 hypothetical protein SB96558_2785 [Shigella boydii 965-58]
MIQAKAPREDRATTRGWGRLEKTTEKYHAGKPLTGAQD